MAKAIMGVTARTPRPTVWALAYTLLYLAVPVIVLLLLIDIGLYLAFRHVLDSCYGVTCLF